MNDKQSDLLDQLRRLGHEPELVNDRVVFDLEVHTGHCDGQTVRVGLDVPDNWPSAASHWIHVEGRFTDGGNVQQSEIGPGWRKFSRPMNEWRTTDRDARALIGHLHRVFDHVISEESDDKGDAVA